MPRPVTITISHDLGADEARNRVRDGFAKLQGQLTGGMMFKFTEEWTQENTLSFTAVSYTHLTLPTKRIV